ncbi:MAG: hypothetical protein GX493_09395, partial [Firmicutes bacterium]|nr:hypothetical protein [Bacillota bacterium]
MKSRLVLSFALVLSFLAASFGLTEPVYYEDFGHGKSLQELGFTGFHPSFWTLDLKGRYMKGINPGGMGRAAEIYTPRFAASRRHNELAVEWKANFLAGKDRHGSEEELAVGLADNRGDVLYRLSISPTRHGKEEGFTLAFYKAGRPHEALLKKVFFKTPLPGWHTFRMIFAPPEAGGGIPVLGEGKEVLSLRDLTYLDFAGLRFAYRAARRHQAVGIDDILVTGGEAPSADTVPPVTRDDYDYEHEHEWRREPVVIHLTAADEGSGVAATYYRINNGPVESGTEITLTADGIYEVSYW